MPDTSKWTQASAYDYWDDLPLEGLAWELLRRDLCYQRAYASGIVDARIWGLQTPVDPKAKAKASSLFWTPNLRRNEVLLSSIAVPNLGQAMTFDATLDVTNPTGAQSIFGHGASELCLTFLEPKPPLDAALCVVIPLDDNLSERINALQRFRRLLNNLPAPNPHISRARRDRLRLMTRAFDGLTHGATQRQIAEALFGSRRIADQDWRSSSLRYTIQRLLRECRRMVTGGYLELLHPSRADKPQKGLRQPANIKLNDHAE